MSKALFAILLSAILLACSEEKPAPQSPTSNLTSANPLEHGEYLVEHVGLCVDCHTPRTKEGAPDMEKHLAGADLGFDPKHPVPGWATRAPGIAGLPVGWTQDDMVTFLETGEKPGGVKCGPPMPPYRFNHDDAVAVAQYLAAMK